MSLFLTFEGIDGAGKSTHIDTLAQAFRARGRTVFVTREPGGTALAETLRSLVLGEPMDSLTEALLVFAARRDHLVHSIEPALQRGEVVLCDRFTDSSFAYQGGGQGLRSDVLGTLERWVQSDLNPRTHGLRQPDLTLLFELAPALAAARRSAVRAPDKFEAQDEAFFTRVAQAYAARAAADPARFARIQADQPREQVWEQVQAALRSAGWLD